MLLCKEVTNTLLFLKAFRCGFRLFVVIADRTENAQPLNVDPATGRRPDNRASVDNQTEHI